MPDLYPAWSHFIQEKLEVSFTCPGTSKNNFTILCSIFGYYYELTCYVENSVDPGSTLFLIVYVCIHTVSKGVYTCILFKHSEGFAQIFVHICSLLWEEKLSMGFLAKRHDISLNEMFI